MDIFKNKLYRQKIELLEQTIKLREQENELLRKQVEALTKEKEDKMSIPNQWERFWNYSGREA